MLIWLESLSCPIFLARCRAAMLTASASTHREYRFAVRGQPDTVNVHFCEFQHGILRHFSN
jgi:hypothetical protein